MTSSTLRVYNGWEKYNSLLERAIAPLSADQLSLRPAENLWSVRTLACHIIGVRAWWFHGWMDEGGDELARFDGFDDAPEAEHVDSATLVDGLTRTWTSLSACLKKWSDSDLEQTFQRPVPNKEGQRPLRSREFIVWHVAEHDLFHGGEISLVLGMHGVKGLDL